jgi:TorA maturation chaperone TorD
MPEVAEHITHLLRRAAVARGLARALARPDEGTVADVTVALRQGEDLQEADLLTAAADVWAAADSRALAEEHTRLFAGSCPCPPWETAWGDGRRMAGRTVELAQIAGAYRAFGLELSEDQRERPDYAATELEFLSVLMMKLAWAEADGLEEQASITRDALAEFTRDHTGRWLHAFATAMEKHAAQAPYFLAAQAAAAFVAGECDRLGVTPDVISGEPRPDAMQSDCMTCPMAGAGPDPSRGESPLKGRTA